MNSEDMHTHSNAHGRGSIGDPIDLSMEDTKLSLGRAKDDSISQIDPQPTTEDMVKAIESAAESLSATDPRGFLNEARDLVDRFADILNGDDVIIRYRCGKKKVTNPKILFGTRNPVKIGSPKKRRDRLKLAALLYTIGRLLDTKLDILYSDSAGKNDFTTKHLKNHRGRLQEAIDALIEDPLSCSISEVEEPSPIEVNRHKIGCVEVTREAYEDFKTLEPCLQRVWIELSHYSDSQGNVSSTSLRRFLSDSDTALEELFCLNEDVFRSLGLGFEIDYGEVDFFTHMERVLELQLEIEELEGKTSKIVEEGGLERA